MPAEAERLTPSLRGSGIRGIAWDAERRKWRAYVWRNRKIVHLGRFVDLQDARNALRDACAS